MVLFIFYEDNSDIMKHGLCRQIRNLGAYRRLFLEKRGNGVGQGGTSGGKDYWIDLGCAMGEEVTGSPVGFVMGRQKVFS